MESAVGFWWYVNFENMMILLEDGNSEKMSVFAFQYTKL